MRRGSCEAATKVQSAYTWTQRHASQASDRRHQHRLHMFSHIYQGVTPKETFCVDSALLSVKLTRACMWQPAAHHDQHETDCVQIHEEAQQHTHTDSCMTFIIMGTSLP